MHATGRADNTDVFIASDHGYSTISDVIRVEQLLREAEFPAIDRPGGVAVAANGGSALLYVGDGEPKTAEKLTAWLVAQPWCGPLFASERVGCPAGTLPLALLGCEGPRSPDLIMSFPWQSVENPAGYAGHAPATGGAVGQGQHGSLSRHELRNTGLAGGPSFKRETIIETPTGNIDFAPTILHLLGLDAEAPAMNGRILLEALENGPSGPAPDRQVYRAERPGFCQELQVSAVGKTQYVDWGNRI